MPQIKSLIGILFCAIFFLPPCGAQNVTPPPGDAYQADSLIAVRNALKTDPLQIVFGVVGVACERFIAPGYSAEVTAGITRRNYAASWSGYSLDNLGGNVDIHTGYDVALALRRYFRPSEELNGMYLALGAGIRDYRTDYAVIDSTGELSGYSFPENRHFTRCFLDFGYQLLPLRSNIFADFYLGLALRWENSQVVHSENYNDPRSYRVESEKHAGLALRGGIRIGFGF